MRALSLSLSHNQPHPPPKKKNSSRGTKFQQKGHIPKVKDMGPPPRGFLRTTKLSVRQTKTNIFNPTSSLAKQSSCTSDVSLRVMNGSVIDRTISASHKGLSWQPHNPASVITGRSSISYFYPTHVQGQMSLHNLAGYSQRQMH